MSHLVISHLQTIQPRSSFINYPNYLAPDAGLTPDYCFLILRGHLPNLHLKSIMVMWDWRGGGQIRSKQRNVCPVHITHNLNLILLAVINHMNNFLR